MTTARKINVGLIGFGVVGKGLYDALEQTPECPFHIEKILIRDFTKKRSAPRCLFTPDPNELLNHPNVDVMVELIDDAEVAFQLVSSALKKGIPVVSANKKMIATHLAELIELQRLHEVPFLYEAAACAGIPVIRTLEDYYPAHSISGLEGIVNGATNYILTQLFANEISYREALLMAQQAGFAESDSSLDTSGADAANKCCVLLAHAFGTPVLPHQFLCHGIEHIGVREVALAKLKQCGIKLVAHAHLQNNGRLAAFVLPQLVDKSNPLFSIDNEYNALITSGRIGGKHLFQGLGAGALPTASAVIGDLMALQRNYRYGYQKINGSAPELDTDFFLNVVVCADQLSHIRINAFEWIEEQHQGKQLHWVSGCIHLDNLLQNDWWKAPGVSLLAAPNPIAQQATYHRISRKSLQLAGASISC